MIGSSIGHYEITAKLGQGGMGEVYRARDTRLNRDVALKVLPAIFAADEHRMGRFRREAQVLASLNHPNIASIYGLESREGEGGTPSTSCLVMELVEGEDLSARTARGPVPLDEALSIALQIAEGLANAHDKGIVHRDLKPANVKLTPDGRVKILDFGLAKALDEQDPDPESAVRDFSHSPTLSLAATQAGLILGTAAYMSPEQARGKPVDRRTDIWAFGVVLFEMLSGRTAFAGEDIALTLAAVVKEEPDWSLVPEAGQPFRQILSRCLTKDPHQRYHHIADVRIAIEERMEHPLESLGQQGSSRLPARSGWRKLALAAAVPAIALLASLITWLWIPEPVPRRVHSSVLPPDQARFEPNAGPVALSPDGRLLALVARTSEGKSLLWVRPLGSDSAQPLQGTEGAVAPFWAPDSRSLGFFADGKLKRIEASGEALETLDSSADEISLGTWNQDGVILFTPYWGAGIHRVSSTGEGRSQLTEPNRNAGEFSHVWPSFLPDGNHYLYSATALSGGQNSVFVGSLDGMSPRFLLNATSNVVYVESGYLLFWREGAIRGQKFDLEHLQLEEAPFTIATGVRFDATLGGLFSASQNGVLAYFPGSQARLSQLLWFDRSGRQLEVIGRADNYYFPRLSHAGSEIVVDVSNLQDVGDLWLLGVSRPVSSRFTFDPGNDSRPVWSPDDRHVVFSSSRGGRSRGDMYLKPTNGGGKAEVLYSGELTAEPTDWSLDGRFILFEREAGPLNRDLWAYDVDGGKALPILESSFMETDGQFSPDGRWMVFVSDESGQREVYIRPFPGPGAHLRISTAGGSMPRWSANGRELFFIAPDRTLMRSAIRLEPAPAIEVPESLFPTRIKDASSMPAQYDVSRDGQRFLINSTIEEGETQPVTLIVNCFEGIQNPGSRGN